MFGQQDGQSDQQDNNIPDESIEGVLNDQNVGQVVDSPVADPVSPVVDPATDAAASNQDWGHPGVPLDSPGQISDIISPAGGFPKPPSFPSTPSQVAQDAGQDTPVSSGDAQLNGALTDIKLEALGELEPLIDALDQTPEEHFRTIMMMIQASDDQNLISKAYSAAHSIEDEKVRAQALLDIINEINYFTQQPATPEN